MDTLHKKIMETIKEVCGEDISPDTDLISDGLLDSYALITILAGLEEFGIEIDPAEEGIESFSTPQKIIDTAEKARRSAQK